MYSDDMITLIKKLFVSAIILLCDKNDVINIKAIIIFLTILFVLCMFRNSFLIFHMHFSIIAYKKNIPLFG